MSSLFSKIQKITALSLAILLAGSTLSTQAQDNNYRGLIVGPAILEINADRGSSYQNSVTLENNSQSDTYNLSPFIQTFTAGDEDGSPVISALPTDSPLNTWVKFLDSGYTLKPGDKQDSKFIVTIPQDTNPGSYYLAVSYRTQSQAQSTNSQVVINEEVSALLFINVKGQTTRDVNFEYLKTDKQIYDPFFDGVEINYRLNTIGTYYKPSGNLYVGNQENPDNQVNLNPNEKIILPGTARTFNILNKPSLNLGFLSSDPTAANVSGDVTNLDDLKKPIIGNQTFTAKVLYVDSDGNIQSKSTDLQVFFFPWKTLLLILLVALAGFVGYKVVKRATRKSK
jgi:hypothetical protein